MTDDPDMTTSMSLLKCVSENDSDGWARFTKIYGPLVYKWCRNAGLQADDASDVGQAVFQAVWQKFPTFEAGRKPSGGFRSWLWGITRYEILNLYRRNQKQPVGAGGSAADLQFRQYSKPAVAGDDPHNASADRILLQAAIRELESEFDPRTWKAFWELAVAGRPAKDIGTELSMTPVAVRQARFRVSRKLRHLLGDDFPGLRNAPAED